MRGARRLFRGGTLEGGMDICHSLLVHTQKRHSMKGEPNINCGLRMTMVFSGSSMITSAALRDGGEGMLNMGEAGRLGTEAYGKSL